MPTSQYVHNTVEVALRERFAYWRDAICDAYVPLQPERGAAGGFDGRIDGLVLPALHASTVTADAHRVHLTAAGRARQKGCPFFVNLMLEGAAVATQSGRTEQAGAGDIYVVDCDGDWEVDFRSRFSMFCIEIDEGLLRPRLGRRGRLSSPVIRGHEGPGRILARYMNLLRELPPQDLAQMHTLMVDHCSDLLARAHIAGDGAAPARVREQTLQRILALVQRRLGDPQLSPESACAELRMSRSYLFKLLSDAGMSFSAHVRQRRLEECRRALRQEPQRLVSDIAAAWGFDDLASFSRAYRQRFGESPTQTRQGRHDD